METSAYQAAKMVLVSLLGLSKDALHVHVGLAVFFAAALLFRRPLRSLVPLAIVFLAAFAGEALDRRDDLATLGYWRWQSSLFDILNTVFWPAVLFGLARLGVLRRGPRFRAPPAEEP